MFVLKLEFISDFLRRAVSCCLLQLGLGASRAWPESKKSSLHWSFLQHTFLFETSECNILGKSCLYNLQRPSFYEEFWIHQICFINVSHISWSGSLKKLKNVSHMSENAEILTFTQKYQLLRWTFINNFNFQTYILFSKFIPNYNVEFWPKF